MGGCILTIIVLILCVCLLARRRDPMKIAFDRRDARRLLAAACIASGIALVSVPPAILFLDSAPADLPLSDGAFLLLYLAAMISPCLTVLFWLAYAEARLYFRRLAAYGYGVPAQKRDYGSSLANLPCEYRIPENAGWESRILTILGAALTAVSILVLLAMRQSERPYAELTVILSVPVPFFWMIRSLLWYRQQDNTKFRDDLARPDARKIRDDLARGIGNALVLAFGSALWMAGALMAAELTEFARRG